MEQHHSAVAIAQMIVEAADTALLVPLNGPTTVKVAGQVTKSAAVVSFDPTLMESVHEHCFNNSCSTVKFNNCRSTRMLRLLICRAYHEYVQYYNALLKADINVQYLNKGCSSRLHLKFKRLNNKLKPINKRVLFLYIYICKAELTDNVR